MGVIAALPVVVYNLIMFIQPALVTRLSKARVYFTTLFSLLLATGGGAFAFLIIIPLALRFFYKFQVDGLIALISADDYLRFVVNVIITFVLIFQLPLLISFIDHIKPLSPKKLLKTEKYIIVGSVAVGVLVPFALDPTVQLLIASPIVILYNLSIVIVIIQHRYRARSERRRAARAAPVVQSVPAAAPLASVTPTPSVSMSPDASQVSIPQQPRRAVMRDISGVSRHPRTGSVKTLQQPVKRTAQRPSSVRIAPRASGVQAPRLISDVRPLRGSIRRQSPTGQRDFSLSQAAE
jgi:hypothetical protein